MPLLHQVADPSANYLQAKPVIGATGFRQTFKPTSRAFSAADVPPRSRNRKTEIVKWKEPDWTVTQQRPWNGSTAVTEADRRDRLAGNLNAVRMGLIDTRGVAVNRMPEKIRSELLEHVKNISGKVVFPGRHSGSRSETGWNSSTTIHYRPPPSVPVRLKLLPKDYSNPTSQSAQITALMREKKVQYSEARQSLKQRLIKDNAGASKERLSALAWRLLDEHLLADEKARRFAVPAESFKPNNAVTLVDRRWKQLRHPGALSGGEWSCCLGGADAVGCEAVVKNPDKWCLASYSHE